jgi:biotin transport system ATP-binding protein
MPTVAEDVAFSLRRSGLGRTERAALVHETLQRFGLAAHADHPAHLLSGGQKQLLALASVLVTKPQVLVCDEPTTLLDARNTRAVAALLAELPQQVILVTHHLDQLRGFDRVLVMEGGRVVADAPPPAALAAYARVIGEPGC